MPQGEPVIGIHCTARTMSFCSWPLKTCPASAILLCMLYKVFIWPELAVVDPKWLCVVQIYSRDVSITLTYCWHCPYSSALVSQQ